MIRKRPQPAGTNGHAPQRNPAVVCNGALATTRAVSTARSRDAGDLSDTVPGNDTEAILFALACAVEQRDAQTAGHCERLALMGVALGVALKLDRASLVTLYRGGYLHDVGKVGIPDSILFKPGKLTADEWITMRSHAVRGQEICRHLKSLEPVLPIIRHHHERWDGGGYPDGLRGTQIPLLARIFQLVDIYDALTNPRPYKPAYASDQALDIIREESGRGWRDPKLVDLFLKLHRDVILRIAPFTAGTDPALARMQGSLAHLQRFLDSPAAMAVV